MPKPQSPLTLSDYLAAVREWQEYSDRFWTGSDFRVSINNRLAKRLGEILDALRGRPEWPRTLETMIISEDPTVRMLAAHQLFDADPERALAIFAEIEHGAYGRRSEEAHWAAQGRVSPGRKPSPSPVVVDKLSSHPSRFDPEREGIAEAVLSVHGAIMNGGFLDAFDTAGEYIADATRGYELIGLPAVADLLRTGTSLFPDGVIPGDDAERRRLIDEAIDAEALESMDGPYGDFVPTDSFLSDKLDAYLG
jgi:hypothetical protein